ncbi:uncharacterized protein A4U43_C08F6470 [Asparagus officinalis]|uniref:putative pentatricopeptide repeat-containing protein At3g25970 n=1 Tax=Asparagus officinalis TaxID=4686 RepID=UPI00098E3C07|nr:putative pentatricopeptide repeat-containing protein At3g25970 [Asparagus officinalis]ONK59442.1 uncharacterized protein A4U43_C08F6470 [Asparagus officinalis]
MQNLAKNTVGLFLQLNPVRINTLHSSHPIKISTLASAARTHAHLLKYGLVSHTSSWNKILTVYARSRRIIDARKVFDEIPQRDTVSWNSLISGYVASGDYNQAWDIFKTMLRRGWEFDQYALGSILKSVASSRELRIGRQLHSVVVRTALDQNVFGGSALVDMYAKCGMIEDAYLVFSAMPERNTVSWNAVITGYSQVGKPEIAFGLFGQMEREGMMPDEGTFAGILTLVNETSCYKLMTQLHAKILKYGSVMSSIVYNAVITAYSQCGSIDDSRKVFEEMGGVRDLVTWNSMLAAFASYGQTVHAIKLFVCMQGVRDDQDMYSFTSVLSACEHGQDVQGKVIHGLVIKRGLDYAIPVSNALITMYMRCSESYSMEDALKCFDSMEFRDKVSWNSIITGLAQNWFSEDALKFFDHMRSVCIVIDQYAFSAALRACSDLAVLQFGQVLHGLVHKAGFITNDFVSSSLVYMYSRCGVIDDARRSFSETHKDSSVIWNSIIFVHATYGLGQIALDLFNEMQELRVEPDHITFVGLISACSHAGLLEEGSLILNSMEPVYGIPLRMEHYACGVDLFGRAGQLDKAMDLIGSMPFAPDAMVWMTLLAACRNHGNMELARHVAGHLLELEPEYHSTYVLLSHMYAGLGMWDNGAMIQRVMRNRGLKKVPGWSWIEVNNKVHSFNAEDRSHPQAKEIYEIIIVLMETIKMIDQEHLHPLRHIIALG